MYFVFYSNVFVNSGDDQVLILNPETNDSIVINNPTFVYLCNKISYPTIHYMIEFSNDQVDEEFFSILEYLENKFYGEMFDTKNKPIQFSPQIKINNNDPGLMLDFVNARDKNDLLNEIGTDILDNVLEISLYYSTLTIDNGLKDICLQYLYPIQDENKCKFIAWDKLFNVNFRNLQKVKLVVGDFERIDIDYIQKLISAIDNSFIEIELYIDSRVYKNMPIEFLLMFSNIYVWYTSISQLENVNKRINTQNNYFLVSDMNTLSKAESLMNIDEIYPLYNENEDFVREYLLFEKKELLKNEISERELLMNMYINSNFFGELSIYPNGNVFSCKNGEPLGNIYRDWVKDMLMKEFCQTRYWFMTRNNLSICRDCIFNTICPPITSNELYMNKWNFCS